MFCLDNDNELGDSLPSIKLESFLWLETNFTLRPTYVGTKDMYINTNISFILKILHIGLRLQDVNFKH